MFATRSRGKRIYRKKLRGADKVETVGRGCLYIIIGIVVVSALAVIVGGTINIPWIIAIPLVILAFWIASKKSKR